MTDKHTLHFTVNYRDVDRGERLLLPVFLQLLQEAAITHANQYDTGTKAMASRGESWVLNRMALDIARYPRFEEPLRVDTWSRGIKGFKGYREFRVFDRENALVLSGTSLWLYVNVESKSIVRVPAAIAAGFPICSEGPHFADIDRLEFAAPGDAAVEVPVTIRYSDVDVHGHVNNTAYFDLVQTALARLGASRYPRRVRLKFAKGIPGDTAQVTVRIEAIGTGAAQFCIEDGGNVFASGDFELPAA